MRITIVYDNYEYDPLLAGGWGFAALVEVRGHRILFDTGGDGEALLGNLALLDVDPLAVGTLVLSHEHRDHTGGLTALLATGATPTVYLPASFSPALKGRVASHTEVMEITAPREILPGVFSTGEMGAAIIEQALVVATPEGAVLITGCAHPGIVEMVRQGREIVPGEIALVVGGFHLVEAGPPAVADIVAAFREMGVRQVAPTHCTGDAARDAFAREYRDDFLAAGVGRVIEVG